MYSYLAQFSYLTAALAYLAAWGMVTRGAGPRGVGWQLQLALLISIAWAVTLAAGFASSQAGPVAVAILEFARYGAWLVALPALIGVPLRAWFRTTNLAILGGALLLVPVNSTLALLALAFGGLVNTEQLLRNASLQLRRPVRFCAIALGGTFTYDLFLYSHLVLMKEPEAEVWVLRGFADALLVPFAVIGLRQLTDERNRIYVSRQVVFYTTAFVAVGIYLLVTAAVGYAVHSQGSSKSAILRPLFFIGAGVVLAVLLVADTPWRRLRVFLSKNFYKSKYDYRKEWLRFVGTLECREGEDARVTSVRAIAQIIESPGGVLFLQDDARKSFLPSAGWCGPETVLPESLAIDAQSDLVGFLERREWVVDLLEFKGSPATYENISVPEWLMRTDAGWRIVSPLFERGRLLGFLVLQAPPEPFTMNFEDRDLLQTAGRHVGTLLVRQATERRLTEGLQFDAFNRFAAFVMHDLKNSVAQLQLLVGNAAQHRHNPEFVNDAFDTIENTVGKMTRLIEQLHAREMPDNALALDPATVLKEGVARAADRKPAPTLAKVITGMRVRADPERLGMVLGHIIRNAQEAAGISGSVTVTLVPEGDQAAVTIADTGPGMDAAFVRDRLFRPFDSTKGSKGMGVGAYQAREYVRYIGGEVEVKTRLGAGTQFIIRLPLCPQIQSAS